MHENFRDLMYQNTKFDLVLATQRGVLGHFLSPCFFMFPNSIQRLSFCILCFFVCVLALWKNVRVRSIHDLEQNSPALIRTHTFIYTLVFPICTHHFWQLVEIDVQLLIVSFSINQHRPSRIISSNRAYFLILKVNIA